jgi:hypothetical protein
VKGTAADVSDSPQPWGLLCNHVMKMASFFFPFFPVVEHWWNEIDREKPKYSGENLSQCHFAHHKSHRTELGSKPGLLGDRPATNRLSHGTVYFWLYSEENNCVSKHVSLFYGISRKCCNKATDVGKSRFRGQARHWCAAGTVPWTSSSNRSAVVHASQ